MRSFFGLNPYASHTLPNFQDFDFDGLAGRLRSSSYMPTVSDANFEPMIAEAQRIFTTHNQLGHVRLEYSTRIYFGRLNAKLDSPAATRDWNLA
jgi:hypothetical protein